VFRDVLGRLIAIILENAGAAENGGWAEAQSPTTVAMLGFVPQPNLLLWRISKSSVKFRLARLAFNRS
jgi:hypothetical protein